MENESFKIKLGAKALLRRLTILNKRTFFSNVIVGRSYQYDFYNFLFQDVKKMGRKRGVIIKYNKPGTKIYESLGTANFTVVALLKKQKLNIQKPQYFDPKNLLNEVN